ncbi:hypothetical protein BDF14DRAFT_1295028 [Spinellus fusiger]|nr:hypothetical protein BDF14DRAFT_1295028 [Spinellus fusiger]
MAFYGIYLFLLWIQFMATCSIILLRFNTYYCLFRPYKMHPKKGYISILCKGGNTINDLSFSPSSPCRKKQKNSSECLETIYLIVLYGQSIIAGLINKGGMDIGENRVSVYT